MQVNLFVIDFEDITTIIECVFNVFWRISDQCNTSPTVVFPSPQRVIKTSCLGQSTLAGHSFGCLSWHNRGYTAELIVFYDLSAILDPTVLAYKRYQLWRLL